ncbi:MAG: hypothetical protein HFI74_05235 [Lachnospiraceae bacterium]|jgi:hypothetical protein|nr:hypothetical protein [Lachnospiraceae bacterium]
MTNRIRRRKSIDLWGCAAFYYLAVLVGENGVEKFTLLMEHNVSSSIGVTMLTGEFR